jgi:hydroxymethylbilane synthase
VAKLDHIETRVAVNAERAVLAALESGCLVPMGVWARVERHELVVEACVLAADGSEALRVQRAGRPNDAEGVGREVAEALRGRGAERLLRAARENVERR